MHKMLENALRYGTVFEFPRSSNEVSSLSAFTRTKKVKGYKENMTCNLIKDIKQQQKRSK